VVTKAGAKPLTNSATGGTVESYAEQIVRKAAEKFKIPFEILWGVYGVETAHGSDVKTSSAGAKGSFQFIESTAKEYGYPYTNETSMKVFSEQATAAAKYLSSLYASSGSWDAALKGYSGGGYGLSQVLAQSKIRGGGNTSPEGTGTGEPGKSIEEEGLGSLSPFSGLEKWLEGGLWEDLGQLALKGVLILAGAFLVVYGIMVAVRPRDSALSLPVPKAAPVPA
jgi:hypothetical protein